MKQLIIGFIFLLLLAMAAFAEDKIDFGPELKICIDSKIECHVPDETEEILNTKDIMFELSLINDGTYGWVCWKNWHYTLTAAHEGEKDPINVMNSYSGQDDNNFCLPPGDKMSVYIPFEEYNKRDGEKRLDGWTIKPSAGIDNVECYKTIQSDKPSCSIYLSQNFESNQISFRTVKEMPKTIPPSKWDKRKEWLSTGWGTFISIATGILVLATLYVTLRAIFKKK